MQRRHCISGAASAAELRAKKPPATGIASPVTLKARSGYNERDLREIDTLTPGQPTISTDDR